MKTLITAMNGLSDGFALINQKGEILYWNPSLERITGLPLENVKTKPVWEIQALLVPSVYNGDNLETQRKLWSNGRTTITASQRELVFDRPDQTKVPVELKYYSMKQGRKTFVCVQVVDLTLQKEKEKILERINKSASHEIRTPLNAVIGFSSILLDDPEYGLPAAAVPFVKMINESGARALDIANSSLLFNKIELGNFKLQKTPVALSGFLQAVSNELASIGNAHGAEIELLPDFCIDKNTVFLAEKGLLQSVLSNLVTNAAEAAPQEHKKIVCTVHVNQGLTFMIHNFGEIPEAIRPHLFQKYATFGKQNGNGLGLHFAKLVTEAHGGTIKYSSANGETFFVVQIPLE